MRLNDVTFVKNTLLTIFIVIVLLLMFSAFRYFTGTREAEGQAITDPPQVYQGIPFDSHLLRLDRRALEEAYHQQLIFLFTVCLKDGCKDATYFQNGLRNARRFYGVAAKQIAAREKELIDKGIIGDGVVEGEPK